MINDRIGEVQYRHYRLAQFDEKADKLVPATRGGVTVAFKFLSPRVVDIGLALCSPDDNFNKSEGRRVAEESWDGSSSLSFTLTFERSEISEEEFELQVLRYLVLLANQRTKAKMYLPTRDFVAWEQRTSIPRWLAGFVRRRLENILLGKTFGNRWPLGCSGIHESVVSVYEAFVRSLTSCRAVAQSG